jgi:hypothetical protein
VPYEEELDYVDYDLYDKVDFAEIGDEEFE